jgi:hypothetical protein
MEGNYCPYALVDPIRQLTLLWVVKHGPYEEICVAVVGTMSGANSNLARIPVPGQKSVGTGHFTPKLARSDPSQNFTDQV